jgi:hypothetical protein
MDKRAMELTLARMAKDFLPYRIDQRLLLPPDMRDWLPEGHWARFVDDLVEQLDRNAIDAVYQSADDRGRRGYHPAMMVKLLVYRMRKAIVEPMFGQIKSVRGLRRFLLRGLANVQDEFRLIAFTHNLLKLASPPGRASPEPVTMAPLSSPKGHPSHASRRSARGRVGFPPYNHVRHGELERSGRAPLEH